MFCTLSFVITAARRFGTHLADSGSFWNTPG
jgi:hypothetical protein